MNPEDKIIADIESRMASKNQDPIASMVQEDTGGFSSSSQSQEQGDADTVLSEIESRLATKKQQQAPEEQANPMASVAGPLEGIGQSILKGYAESASGANTKLLAISKLLSSPIFDTKDLQDNFRKNSQYWQQVAGGAEEQGGNNMLLNMLGGLPIAAAEFGATKNPVSMVVAGGVLSALQDYGKEVEANPDAEIKFGQTAGSFATGAAVTGAALGAFHVTGVGVEALAKMVQKHGVQSVKNMFTAMNGGDERMGQKAIDLLSDPKYNKNEKLPDVGTFKEQQQMRVDEYKGQSKDQFYAERQAKQQEMFQRQKDFDFNIRQQERQIRNDIDLKVSKADDAIFDMQDKKLQVIDTIKDANSDQIAQSASVMADTIGNAKNSVREQIDTVFSGMIKKVEGLKKQTGDAIGESWSKLIEAHPGEGAIASKIIERIKMADGNEQLFNFKNNGGFIFVTPKVDNKVMNEAAAQLQSDLASSLYQRAGMGSKQSTKVSANTMKITHDIFDNFARMPEGQGSIAPGIGKVYSKLADAFHIKHYADDFSPSAKQYVDEIVSLNKKYGDYKDNLSTVYSRYFKKDGENIVPRTDEIFSKFDRGDRMFEAKLINAEKIPGLKNEDKVYSQVRKAYENFSKVRSTEEQVHLSLKKSMQRNIAKENIAFRESIKNLRMNKRTMSVQESQKLSDVLFAMKQTRDVENKAISDAFDGKLRQLAQSRAEGLRSLKDAISEENLTLETKKMLRSNRPQAGTARVMQNIGLYGAAGGAIGGLSGTMSAAVALPLVIGKGILAVAASPRALAKGARFALKNKEAIKKITENTRQTGKVMKESVLLKRLIASQTGQ